MRQYLWPASSAELERGRSGAGQRRVARGDDRERFHDLEEAMRRGPGARAAADHAPTAGTRRSELIVDVPAGPSCASAGAAPSALLARHEWPLMFAMHGGPPGQPAQARSGAERMIRVWEEAAEQAGWIVAAPAMTPSVTAGPRTESVSLTSSSIPSRLAPS